MTIDYSAWTALLGEVVQPDGKVDYEALAERRPRLAAFVRTLTAVSPDATPAQFPTGEDALAYWLNAYNAFVLAAIVEEYPIRSVWKTREGQFFERRRHVAGGALLSLNDIEHRILRGRFRDPRIHFAINCGTNGCPPLRPGAWEPRGLHETLRDASRRFLASEWNCRVDHAERTIFVSRLFKMYAEDFAGDADSTTDYRRGVLQFVAAHTGTTLDALAGYELVYNVYDWGLNDSRRDPQLRPITFHESVETFREHDTELRELYLYDGNFCNRACQWCTVFGSPSGWHVDFAADVLDAALRAVARDGNIKFYGGEPTLHADGVIAAMRRLRAGGFAGRFTIYSNGVRARALLRVLESDARSEAVLNYSIYRGRDAEPLPARSRELLEAWSRAHPMRLFSGYKVLYHAGAAAGMTLDRDRESAYHGHDRGCLLCFPVLTSTGRYHACPLAIENAAAHYDLGDLRTDPATVLANYRRFRLWAHGVLDPAARARGISSCEMCARHVETLRRYDQPA